MTATEVPEGFEPHSRKSPLTEPWEPLYSKRTDKAVIIGLRLAKPHTNSRGLIHGGLIASLADNAMGYSCGQVMSGVISGVMGGAPSSLVTISLAVDFIGTAQIGQWLAVESEVIRTGQTICFAQSLIKADEAVIAHLAGALGRPVWVALRRVSEWRWFNERADSPWYPTMRLFRCGERDDWFALFDGMAAEIRRIFRLAG